MDNYCEKCNKIFSTKYTLKNHIKMMVCDQDGKDGKDKNKACPSLQCGYRTFTRTDIQKHIKTCKYIEMENLTKEIKCEYEEKIRKIEHEYEEKIKKIEHEYEKKLVYITNQNEKLNLEKQLISGENNRLTSLLEKAMNKPIITTNNTNNTTIKGNNNNLQNILAPYDLFEKQIDPERIRSIDHSIIEKHFWLGQKGIARLCVDHIIKSVDGNGNNKLLLCCTDPSRKRFKYIDATNQITEDIEARNFINLVSVPIKTVCRDVYDNVIKKIEDDKKETTDAFDLNLLESRTSIAQQKFLEINDISDHRHNSDYKNEMSILLNT
jgi:hypothetical protein